MYLCCFKLTQMLNTTNSNLFHYHTEKLHIDILGGINLLHLDRLRVTLKFYKPSNTTDAIRNSLDLYNDTQVEKFIRSVAERLEVGTSITRKHLQDLINDLEAYRVGQLEEIQVIHELTPEDEKEALKLLKSKDLLTKTNSLIAQSGVVGEVNNRLLMYLIFTSRKSLNPLHCVSLGKSGTGKSHLQNSVGNLMPQEDVIEITSLSANALYYFQKDELNQKLLLIEDLDGAENALYPIRELQSRKKLTKTVVHKDKKGERKTIHVTVNGNVTVAGCTTQESIYEDNANRSFLIYIDESTEQVEKIMEYQRLVFAGKIDTKKEAKAKKLLQNVQRVLKQVKVINPFAEHLKLPSSVFKPRRTNAHYLGFIEAVTFCNQYTRPLKKDKEGNEYIETTITDIEQANTLILELESLIRKSDNINVASRAYSEQLRKYLIQENKTHFQASEIRRVFKLNKTTQWRYHRQLLDYGLLSTSKDAKTKQVYYELHPDTNYEEVKEQIKSQLEQNTLLLEALE